MCLVRTKKGCSVAKRISNLVDYAEDSSGKSLPTLSFHFGGDLRDYQAEHFNEALAAWMLALDIVSPADMLHRIDLDVAGGISEQDFTDLMSDTAVPSPRLTRYLTEAYRRTMAGSDLIREMSPSEFSTLGHLKHREYETKGRNEFGHPYRVISVEPELLETHFGERVLAHPPTPHPAPAVTSANTRRLLTRPVSETIEHPFYLAYEELLKARAQSLNLLAATAPVTPADVERAFLTDVGIERKVLQGFMPAPATHSPSLLASKLGEWLFGDAGLLPKEGPVYEKRTAFEKAAEDFYGNVKGYDYVNARRNNGLETYGQVLSTLMHWTNTTNAMMSEGLKQRGYNVSEQMIDSFRHDRTLPTPRKARVIGDILGLDTLQRAELRHAHDFSAIQRKIHFVIERDVPHLAGTPEFTCQSFCKRMFETVPLNLDALGFYVGIYGKTLEAYAKGELIPSAENMRTLCEFFHISAHYTDVLSGLPAKELAKITEPEKLSVQRAFGGATMATTSQDIVDGLVNKAKGGAFTAAGISERSGVPIGTVHNCHTRHYPQDDKTIDGLMQGLGISPDSAVRGAYTQANRAQKKPFGILLEDYIAGGGHSLEEFISRFTSAEKGWNISDRAFRRMVGFNEGSVHLFEGEKVKSGREVEMLVKAFRLTPHQELLLWQLGRGDPNLPEPRIIISVAQERLLKGEDAGTVAKETFDDLLAQSGLTEKRLSELTRKKGRKGETILVSTDTIGAVHTGGRKLENLSYESLDQLGTAFSPFNDAFARGISNVFLGVPFDKTLNELITDARKDADFGKLIHTARTQMRLTQAEFGKYLGVVHGGHQGITGSNIGKWERGQTFAQNDAIAEACAKFIGYEAPDDVRDFVALARGKYINPETIISPAALLEKSRTDESFTFQKFVETVMNQENLSNNGLAKDIQNKSGVKMHDVQVKKWLEGHPATLAQAEAFATRMGYTGDDRAAFLTYATTPSAERAGNWQGAMEARTKNDTGTGTPGC